MREQTLRQRIIRRTFSHGMRAGAVAGLLAASLCGQVQVAIGKSGVPVAKPATESTRPSLHFTRFGKGPAVVFLHGLGGDTSTWVEQAQRLERTHTVLLVNLPGHGGSPAPAKVDFVEIGKQIAGLIRSEKLAPATVVGHSMGGTIAGYVALADQGAIKSLVIVDSILSQYPFSQSERDRIRFQMNRDTVQALNDLFGPGAKDRVQLDKVIAAARRVSPATLMGYLDYASEHDDLEDRVREIHVPVYAVASPLMTGGQSDPSLVQASLLRAGFAGLPDLSFDLLAGTKHWPHWDQPDAFFATLTKFLTRLEPVPVRGIKSLAKVKR